MLHGRAGELAAVDRLLDGARHGRSGALVVRGEAGIGKSAILDHAAAARDMTVLRGTGIESESELPYAGLHLLLGKAVDRIGALPAPQARALRGALGIGEPARADRFLTGLAVLSLLAELAEERPLLVLVDDAHWLDEGSAQALLLAARRLDAEPIAMIFAVRDGHAPAFGAPGLPELRLGGLDEASAAELLAERAADLAPHVREQIRHQAQGNPLALLELAAAQREGRLAAETAMVRPLPAHSRVRRTFAERIAAVPPRTRTVLLVVAADDTGDPAVVLAAARRLGATTEDLEPAERRGLVHLVEGRLDFRHPLIRTVAYQEATLHQRLAVHRALAEVMDAPQYADRRARHLAAATTGPDEEVAAELERSAEQARARGGYGAVAAAYARAAELTPDPRRRGRRLAAAARAAVDAGRLDQAERLADEAAGHLTDPLELAEVAEIRAALAGGQGRQRAAHDILAEAALSVARRAPQRASGMLFHAVEAAWNAVDFEAVAATAGRAAALGLPGGERIRAMARVADGLNHLGGGDMGDGLAALRELVAFTGDAGPRESATVAFWHLLLGDHEAAHDLAAGLERQCRARSALGALPRVLGLLARAQLLQGRHREARSNAAEGLQLARDIGQPEGEGLPATVLAQLAAIEGDEEEFARISAAALDHATGTSPLRLACARSLLDLGLGRYEAAADRLTEIAAGPARLDGLSSMPDLVEAAVRLGRTGPAREITAWYADWAEHTGRPWALAVASRCRALTGQDVGRHYARAVELHREPGGRPFEQARTELLYGEWLRRARRPSEARTHLRAALETFERLPARPWAERARTELRAAGETTTGRAPDDLTARLTPQELQVARLAAAGLSNREIGAQLFLSPRTVGYHLSNAYPKLGVTSRAALAGLGLGPSAGPSR
ncbi:helix-turn-helix transcriptional regulator [Thermomonospora amylolytica]|uniref:helix-turn-helix transcriptional regulator n=1 Tax=Thermomonospora amylolytica TaxID=1411117 RepID=UPI0018E58D96|nr:helix-turn-helix transcriptional regulator [Thermomonospora amylolytica]